MSAKILQELTRASSPPLFIDQVKRLPWEWFAVFIAFIYLAWCFAFPLRTPISVYGILQDDAYYYLKIATNMAAGRGSTFNGIVPTNGYHPLWLLILSGLCLGTHGLMVQICAVCLFGFVACIFTFYLSNKLCGRLGLPIYAGMASALLVLAFACQLFTEGMEVTLTVPLMVGFLVYVHALPANLSSNQAVLVGGFASALILSRLDTALWLGMVALFSVCDPDLRRRFKPAVLLFTGLGLLPVAAYLLVNKVVFHTWSPISGQAKQLKRLGFNPQVYAVFGGNGKRELVFVLGALAILMALFVAKNWKNVPPFTRSILLPTALFPFFYYGILACTSDWPLWPWYFYPCPVAFLAVCAWILEAGKERVHLPRLAMGALLLFGLGRCLAFKWHPETEIGDAAVRLQQFASSHPGVYAMGDRAGAVSTAIDQPIVQTEGLVMDSSFLDNIKQKRNLKAVLRAYGVRYYIATTGNAPQVGGFYAQEPFQGGPQSPKMTTVFTGPPVLFFQEGESYTRVYDLWSRQANQ